MQTTEVATKKELFCRNMRCPWDFVSWCSAIEAQYLHLWILFEGKSQLSYMSCFFSPIIIANCGQTRNGYHFSQKNENKKWRRRNSKKEREKIFRRISGWVLWLALCLLLLCRVHFAFCSFFLFCVWVK